jgi:TetR/AcrR family transcriptional repressor of nem operon
VSTTTETQETILAAARLMVQARGYNSLSFRDLAKEVGIKSASIYYYYPSKGGLGAALARRYGDDLVAYLTELRATTKDWKACIASYTEVFRNTLLRGNRMCLCGILAAEREDLAPEVTAEVERFNALNVQWLSEVLASGKPKMAADDVRQWALAVLAAVEGAQLVARGSGDVAVFDQVLAGYRVAGLLP